MSSWPKRVPPVPPAPAGPRAVHVIDPVFEQFFREQEGQTVRLAHLITGSNVVGEEIAQEAFAAVYVRWEELREPVGYLRTSVVNRSRSYLRREAVARRGTRTIAATVQNTEDSYGDADGTLRSALAGLNERQRTAVVLRYWAGLSEREIATELGCRPGTVKSALSRAMDELRKVMGE